MRGWECDFHWVHFTKKETSGVMDKHSKAFNMLILICPWPLIPLEPLGLDPGFDLSLWHFIPLSFPLLYTILFIRKRATAKSGLDSHMITWNSGGFFFFFFNYKKGKGEWMSEQSSAVFASGNISRSSPCASNHSAFRFYCQVWITAPDFSLIFSRLPTPVSAVSSCSHFTKHQKYLSITESQW